jgi:hypothetical protein
MIMQNHGLHHFCLQDEPDEHGQGKWEGKQEGKSDKRITENHGLPVNKKRRKPGKD